MRSCVYVSAVVEGIYTCNTGNVGKEALCLCLCCCRGHVKMYRGCVHMYAW